MTDSSQPLFELAGGEPRLREVIEDFYQRVFEDVMIGFFFKGMDHPRLVQLELEFALRLLGAEVAYTGRPLPEAHASHRIMGGQFNRRLQILKETLADHELAPEVVDCWIKHTISLRHQITPDAAGECHG